MGIKEWAAWALACWLGLGLWTVQAEAGQLALSADNIEFGRVKEGVVAERALTLTNGGQAPLSIKNVSAS